LQAPSQTPSVTSWKVQSFVTARGTTVREYIGNGGIVFGVAWQGHRPPDLSTLLGPYYAEYTAASAAAHHKDLHRARYAGPNVVVSTAGRMGFVTGRANVAGLAPSDVDPNDVVR
jgi:hypothetical protein